MVEEIEVHEAGGKLYAEVPKYGHVELPNGKELTDHEITELAKESYQARNNPRQDKIIIKSPYIDQPLNTGHEYNPNSENSPVINTDLGVRDGDLRTRVNDLPENETNDDADQTKKSGWQIAGQVIGSVAAASIGAGIGYGIQKLFGGENYASSIVGPSIGGGLGLISLFARDKVYQLGGLVKEKAPQFGGWALNKGGCIVPIAALAALYGLTWIPSIFSGSSDSNKPDKGSTTAGDNLETKANSSWSWFSGGKESEKLIEKKEINGYEIKKYILSNQSEDPDREDTEYQPKVKLLITKTNSHIDKFGRNSYDNTIVRELLLNNDGEVINFDHEIIFSDSSVKPIESYRIEAEGGNSRINDMLENETKKYKSLLDGRNLYDDSVEIEPGTNEDNSRKKEYPSQNNSRDFKWPPNPISERGKPGSRPQFGH